MKQIWWKEDTFKGMSKEDKRTAIVKSAISFVGDCMSQMTNFYNNSKEFELMYQKRSYSNFTSESDSNSNSPLQIKEKTPAYNVVRMNVNTATNKVAKIKPKVTFLTKEKDEKEQTLAKKIYLWTLKQFKKGNVWRECQKGFVDSCISDLGIVKIIEENKKFIFRKIHPRKFFCSNPWSGSDIPYEGGETDVFPLYELIEMFPNMEKDLIKMHDKEQQIKIYEIFRTGKKQIICTDKVLIHYQDWKHNFIPYEPIRWTLGTEGVIGFGLVNEIVSLQERITEMLGHITDSSELNSVVRYAVAKGSNISEKDFNNAHAGIISYSGERAPTVLVSPIMHEQFFRHVETLYVRSFDTGISQLSAAGQIPAGLNQASGLALRNYHDIGSERFQIIKQEYENVFVNIAKKMLRMAPPKEFNDFIKEKDLEDVLDELQIYPTPLLPEEPTGQLQTVTDLMNIGFVSRDQALGLIDSPDIHKFLKSENARVDAINSIIENSLENNEKIKIDSALGIDLQLDIARRKYAELKTENKEENEDKIVLLNNFISSLIKEVQIQQQEMMIQQGGGVPQGSIPQAPQQTDEQ